MNIEEYREYCLSLPKVEETLPFDDVTLVYKIGGKVFTLATMEEFDHFAVKCNPDEAIGLRERYSAVTPAFHLKGTSNNSPKHFSATIHPFCF